MTAAAAALADAMKAGGWTEGGTAWNWATGPAFFRVAPDAYKVALRKVALQIQDRVQDLILKDMASARDEATPPEFRELVERYYEVLSRGGGGAR